MASSTLDRLLRIQSTEPTTSRADAGAPTAPAPPPEARGSVHKGRGSSPYSKQFRVAFDFLQRYTDNPPRSPDDWSAVCDDMTRRANEGDNDPLLIDMLVAAFEQVERVYKATETARP